MHKIGFKNKIIQKLKKWFNTHYHSHYLSWILLNGVWFIKLWSDTLSIYADDSLLFSVTALAVLEICRESYQWPVLFCRCGGWTWSWWSCLKESLWKAQMESGLWREVSAVTPCCVCSLDTSPSPSKSWTFTSLTTSKREVLCSRPITCDTSLWCSDETSGSSCLLLCAKVLQRKTGLWCEKWVQPTNKSARECELFLLWLQEQQGPRYQWQQ